VGWKVSLDVGVLSNCPSGWGWWSYTWIGLHLIRELLRTSSLEEGAVVVVGE
jgi:hypothetical protein